MSIFLYHGIFLVLLLDSSSKMLKRLQQSCYYRFEMQFQTKFVNVWGKGTSSKIIDLLWLPI